MYRMVFSGIRTVDDISNIRTARTARLWQCTLQIYAEYWALFMNMYDDDASNVDVLEEFAERTCLNSSLYSQQEHRVDSSTESELEVERHVQVLLPTLPSPLSYDDCTVELQPVIERGCCSWE